MHGNGTRGLIEMGQDGNDAASVLLGGVVVSGVRRSCLLPRRRLFTDGDEDAKCWNCGRTPITRQATAQDNAERRYDTMRGGAARELRRLTDTAS